MHIPAVTRPQTTPVGPLFGRARESEADRAVYGFKTAKARPNIASGEKLRAS